MRREAIFQGAEEATAFIAEVFAGSMGAIPRGTRRMDYAGITVGGWETAVKKHRGRAFYSTRRRELHAYHAQKEIYAQDREYLHERDPYAQAINVKVPKDTWFKFPIAYEPGIDGFLQTLSDLGFEQAATAADIGQRRDGGAFVYLVTSGNPSRRLEPGDKWLGFEYICDQEIVEESEIEVEGGSDPMMPHKIESLEIYRDIYTKSRNDTIAIHGSRLFLLREDVEAKWWIGRPKGDGFFDQLVYLRDVEYSHKQTAFEGNPIVVEVDVENQYTVSDEKLAQIKLDIQGLRNVNDTVAPVEGLKVTRIGKPDLDDPEPIIRLEVSRIAANTEMPVNMLLASSRGSEQVTEQDRMDYASNLGVRKESFVLPILKDVLKRGQLVGQFAQAIRFPYDLEWPLARTLGQREIVFVDKSDAATLAAALKVGRLPPPRILRKFPINVDGVDQTTLLPTQPKAADLDSDGEPSDPPEPKPAAAGGFDLHTEIKDAVAEALVDHEEAKQK